MDLAVFVFDIDGFTSKLSQGSLMDWESRIKRGFSRQVKQYIKHYTQCCKKTPHNQVNPVPADGKNSTHQYKDDESINKELTSCMTGKKWQQDEK